MKMHNDVSMGLLRCALLEIKDRYVLVYTQTSGWIFDSGCVNN